MARNFRWVSIFNIKQLKETNMRWPIEIGIKPYYEDDYCVIYNGDCRDILPELPKVDLVLTDPPYGIGEAGKKHESRGKLCNAGGYGQDDWDDSPIDDDIISHIFDIARHSIIFGGNYYDLPPTKCWLIWDKDNGSNDFADCEMAWTDLPQAVRLKKYTWNGMLQQAGRKHEKRLHPTQKPLEIMSWCISQADKHFKDGARLIVDPMCGSGTTLRAAKDLQRKCIGIELEEKYCEIAAKRLAQEVLPL